jgi:RND family efflux transporter MFP subunit
MKMASSVSRSTYMNLLENTVLRSPVNGIVTARNYDAGDMYAMAAPVYVVEQISPVKLKVSVSEKLFTQIKKGMEVDVKLDVYGDEIFKGKVSLVYPTIDAATRTFPVEITIANANQRVRPGMFARVTFSYGTAHHVVVPDKAVVKQTGSGDRYVYVLENGKVEFKNFTVQYRPDSEIVLNDISFSIHQGEKVGIVGRTGSGKSTIALCMFRILEAKSGSILIDVVDISEIGLYKLRSSITIIPQDPALMEGSLRLNSGMRCRTRF